MSEERSRVAGNRIVRLSFPPFQKDIIYFFFFMYIYIYIYNTCNIRVCVRFVVQSTIAILFLYIIPLFSHSSRVVRFPSFWLPPHLHFLPWKFVSCEISASSGAYARTFDRSNLRDARAYARLYRCKNKISVDSTFSIYTSIKNTLSFVISKSVFLFFFFFLFDRAYVPQSSSHFTTDRPTNNPCFWP